MKHSILGAILSLSFGAIASAQDIIITKDAEKIEAKIISVNRSTIDYKESNNSNGEVKTMLKSRIASISYENGDVEVYNTPNAGSASTDLPQRKVYQPLTCSDMDFVTVKGNKFFFNDRALSRKEVSYAMKNCCPEAFKTYKSGQHTMVAGVVTTSVGLGFCGIGSVLMIVGAALTSEEDEDYYEYDYLDEDEDDFSDVIFDTGLGMFVIGGTATCVGVPLWIVGAHKKKKGFNQFKENCIGKSSAYNEPIHIDLVSHKRSLGLALKF